MIVGQDPTTCFKTVINGYGGFKDFLGIGLFIVFVFAGSFYSYKFKK